MGRIQAMEGQNQNDELYPIAVLIDELKVLWPPTYSCTRLGTLMSFSMMMSSYA